ncbi:lytic transglycosylase domain-containing protein [Variovorax sp. NFACC27]|uniref:lytic transglycosylase domain-containing protein n=1 Tax=unclassified Variovorax TaxID=663243 RepID=UPI0008963710|nr:Transglycosylase SLT domain-containing protein [Variovorax sp. NFACC28]SEF71410.1 Transglycosylase SLT domain-containing protein [Variovorax sp. NFACC29]SFB76814.1 Transglycosylase SLT domain-containing protein [Variovorax sp. NFACC26]SFG76456.1 Transglycosylase SLT domain-containing protein [Variovorax sp. NFACC27]
MELFNQLEGQFGLPAGLLDAVWAQESSRGRAMLSPKGAKGHMGFMDATAQQYGVADPNNLTQAATGAARMYSDLLRQYGGDLPRALAAYNWGQGNLARKGMDAAPAETRNYIREVTAAMGQPQARAPQQDAPSDDWATLNAQFAPGARQGAQEPDPWAELGAKFAQPAAPTGAPAPARTQQPQQQATGSDPVRRAATAAIPFAGPLLAALDIDPDVPAALKGLAGGFADLGQTLMNRGTKVGADAMPTNPDVQWMVPENVRRPERGVSTLVTGQQPASRAEKANAERAASLDSFYRDNAGNPWFTGGRIAGNVIATMPVGGAVAAPVRAAAPVLAPLADAIATGGFRTGLAPTTLVSKAGNVALRGVGGAATGGASAGLINPDEALLGAGIGGVLPPALSGLAKGGDLLAAGARRLFAPQSATDARAILQAGGIVPADIPAVRAALQQQGPNIVPEGPTVAQILQNPEISQLERSVRNAPGGAPALIAKDQAQNAARLGVVNDIAPVAADLPAARTNFGNTIAPLAADARAAASKEVRQAFDAVDPFNETRFYLPLPEMEASKAKFLGPGTFGTGSKAQAAIDTATDVGTEVLPAVTAATAPGVRRQGQTIVDAIKSLGGIKQDSPGAQALAGEIADLKQAGGGMRSIIQNGRGQSPDTLAQAMHAQGFIPNEDPATLLEVLRIHAGGDKVFAKGVDRSNVFRAGMEAAQGEAPGAEVIRKTVPFQTVQNLRSSIGEAAEQARMRGANKEAAALDSMKADIDKRVNLVQIGQGDAGEHFPPDVVAQWRKAIDLHADKQDRFARGPQAGMFRKGGDGNYSVEGGELAPKFFSPRLSQAEDIEALKRMRLGDPVLKSLKSYATTDASRRVTSDGTLRSKAFNDWLDAHGGAIRGLFDDAERARLTGVGADLKRASDARDLGRATGSNTSQNVQNALGLGLLDSRAVNLLASRTPFVGRFTGPMLDALRESAKRGKAARIGGLLSDPEELDRAIAAYQQVLASQAQRPALVGSTSFGPALYRAAPVLLTGR